MHTNLNSGPLKLEAGGNNPFENGCLQSWTIRSGQNGYFPRYFDPSAVPAGGTFPSSVITLGESFIISFDNLARFEICFDDRTITAFDVAAETDQAGLSHLLFDHIAPRILAHEGALVLHGSAVAIGGSVAIFLGETGTGKSTLAASLHQAGDRLLGDDAVIITHGGEAFFAESVYPSLRLFPDTVSELLGEAAAVSAMAHYSDKQRVALQAVKNAKTAPLPISALFLLSGDAEAANVAVHRPSAAQACIAALEQSFSLDPMDGRRAAMRLAKGARLVESVAVFELDYPNGYDQLDQVRNLIIACMKGGEPTQAEAV